MFPILKCYQKINFMKIDIVCLMLLAILLTYTTLLTLLTDRLTRREYFGLSNKLYLSDGRDILGVLVRQHNTCKKVC